jgi:hypothetical protein
MVALLMFAIYELFLM